MLLLLFGGAFVSFMVAATLVRTVSRGYIPSSVAWAFVQCVVNFIVIQHIGRAKNITELFAYACGGAVGAGCALIATRKRTYHVD